MQSTKYSSQMSTNCKVLTISIFFYTNTVNFTVGFYTQASTHPTRMNVIGGALCSEITRFDDLEIEADTSSFLLP